MIWANIKQQEKQEAWITNKPSTCQPKSLQMSNLRLVITHIGLSWLPTLDCPLSCGWHLSSNKIFHILCYIRFIKHAHHILLPKFHKALTSCELTIHSSPSARLPKISRYFKFSESARHRDASLMLGIPRTDCKTFRHLAHLHTKSCHKAVFLLILEVRNIMLYRAN